MHLLEMNLIFLKALCELVFGTASFKNLDKFEKWLLKIYISVSMK
jgi:hypothetical protein